MAWMLAFPLGLLLGLDDGLGLMVGGGPVHLLLRCALFCQAVSSFVASHIAVRGNPLQGDSVSLAYGGKGGGQVVQSSVSVRL